MKVLSNTKFGAEYLRQHIMRSVSAEDSSQLKSLETRCRLQLRKGLSSPILLEKNGEYLRLSKGKCVESGGEFDFTLLLRLVLGSKSIEWWPVEWATRGTEKIVAEITVDGRRFTNIHIQSELIEIANTWGKSISAQRVASDLDLAQ
jgi:hypothetical protein